MYEIEPCPVCGENYAHIMRVEVNALGKITTVSPNGTTCYDGEQSGRGTRVEITFGGECTHQWIRSYQFHKGETLVDVTVIGEVDLETMVEMPRE